MWLSGSRTHDRRNQDPLLYPTELSSGEPRGIEPRAGEPAPASSRRSRRWHVRDLRHTPRQRRAHQPVVETGPLVVEGAGHRQHRRAIMFGCDADNVQALPCTRRKSSGTAEKPGSVSGGSPRGVQFWHRGSLCRRKRKRPGTCVPRASSGLGDRGGRSPQGGYQAVVSWSSLPNARAGPSMRRHGSILAMATECAFKGSFQWVLKRGAHDKPRFSRAQPFC